VWHARYVGHRFEELDHLVETRRLSDARMDLYVLTTPDIPFEHDAVRGSSVTRAEMQEAFRSALSETGRHYVEVFGSPADRCTQAIPEIERLLEASRGSAAHTSDE
jgi:nicotinamide riboside kinase